MTRTRFSPSPTGLLHFGNARTALFSALYAKSKEGAFVLRIEDTDAARSETKYTDMLENDLHWISIHWQEGPKVGGNYGPYFQSQRNEIYATYYNQLEKNKLAYPCFCSDQELMLNRKIQLSRGQAPRYPGTCSHLTTADIEARIAKGLKPTLRFRMPVNTMIEFVDSVKGLQKFNSDDIGDFIIRRADGSSSFMFCNAIDDSLMKITHVLRGEDHLANTPKQLMILKALELSTPQYGHVSLITGEDGAPLSKREGGFSLVDFRKEGFLAIAVINYLARLGHTIDDAHLLEFADLAKHFQLEKLSRSSARFDSHQLLFWQKTAVMALDKSHAWEWVGEGIKKLVPEDKRDSFIELVKHNCCFPKEAEKWANIFFHEVSPLDNEMDAVIKTLDEKFIQEAGNAVENYGTDIKNVLEHLKKTTGRSGKNLFLPMRLLLTGEPHGPELAQIAQMLGKSEMIRRLNKLQ